MKIGDLVKLKSMHRRQAPRAGLIVDLIEKKCWRTGELGNKVDWNKVDPEPHAVVLVNGKKLTLPMVDLEAVNEGR
tara:strand:+ start:154 stop:381 length:228 start_codon:yes stop_codon:yes gene_type:complete